MLFQKRTLETELAAVEPKLVLATANHPTSSAPYASRCQVQVHQAAPSPAPCSPSPGAPSPLLLQVHNEEHRAPHPAMIAIRGTFTRALPPVLILIPVPLLARVALVLGSTSTWWRRLVPTSPGSSCSWCGAAYPLFSHRRAPRAPRAHAGARRLGRGPGSISLGCASSPRCDPKNGQDAIGPPRN